ncbi:MAG: FAD-dependent oxidoreductase [Clostridia bacterium]|nr:FAD-dependent oxidoreductase [Clostridia bacterium]
MKHYDVIVVGGGPAGVCAAISSARMGKKTLIVEATNALGGAMNNMLVLPFMPYWTPVDEMHKNPIRLVRGIFEEITLRHRDMVRELEGEGAFYDRIPMDYFNEEYIKIILARMVSEAGAEVLYHAKLVSAEAEDKTVKSITVAVVGGTVTLTADCFIDCTGDAELAYLAGFETVLGRPVDHLCQPMTLCFRLANVDRGVFYQNMKETQQLYREAKARGEIDNPRENILAFSSVAPGVLHLNTTRIIKHNPTDPFDLSHAETEVREQVYQMFRFLRKYARGCENAILLSSAAHIGVRESRMIVGEYTLTKDDLLANRKFDDGIAACNYDIDIHNPEGSGTSHYFFPPYEYYTIPWRTLVPKGSQNLLVAGRCISSDHDAQASYRVIPFAAALGEAAGVGAAVALNNGTAVKDAPVEQILCQLRAQGAFIEKELPPREQQ